MCGGGATTRVVLFVESAKNLEDVNSVVFGTGTALQATVDCLMSVIR